MNDSAENSMDVVVVDNFFESVYDTSVSKTVPIAISIFAIFFFTPIAYFVIWDERNGPDTNRTLLNKLVVTVCGNSIVFLLLCQTSEVALSLYGPFPTWLCSCQNFLKNVAVSINLKITFAMILVRHLSVFVLKNPVGMDYDFWDQFYKRLSCT